MITLSIYQGKEDKLSPVTKELWVSALRSGVFKQSTIGLCSISPDKEEQYYCCLGVLYEVIREPFGIKKNITDYSTNWNPNLVVTYEFVETEKSAELHRPLLEFLGLTKHQAVLIEKNDAQGLTFNQIADYIERSL